MVKADWQKSVEEYGSPALLIWRKIDKIHRGGHSGIRKVQDRIGWWAAETSSGPVRGDMG